MHKEDLSAVYSQAEIMQSAFDFLANHSQPEPHLAALVKSFEEEVGKHNDTVFDLTIQHPNCQSGVDMGKARFDKLTRNENGTLQADFYLEPEGVPCPVGVEHILVK